MPASKPYDFHSEAWAEFETAESWYRQRSPDAALRFLAEIYDALEEISRSPQTWPEYLYGCRKYSCSNFLTQSFIERQSRESRSWRYRTDIAGRDTGEFDSNE